MTEEVNSTGYGPRRDVPGRFGRDCDVCILGKLTQNRNRKPDARATAPLECLW